MLFVSNNQTTDSSHRIFIEYTNIIPEINKRMKILNFYINTFAKLYCIFAFAVDAFDSTEFESLQASKENSIL